MRVDWIAVDWGTRHLRAWALRGGSVLDQRRSEDGRASLPPAAFEPALLRLIEPWLGPGTTPVIASGLRGGGQGLPAVAYRNVPCLPLDPAALVPVPVRDPRITLHIVPGLAQKAPADVMEGKETQIAGALAADPGFDGAICLPGTHSKWVQVSAGEVVSFQTFMTGELFALLSRQSVLRDAMTGDGWNEEAFDRGVADGMARPERLSALLFRLRAEGQLGELPAPAARARLSGLLIGAELSAARPYWLGNRVMVVGDGPLGALYGRALAAQGLPAERRGGDDCRLAGLVRARAGSLGAKA